MRRNLLRILLLALVLSLGFRPVSAQIINTLRGFTNEEQGWSGGAIGAVAVAQGNTEYFELELDGKIQYQTPRHRVRAIGLFRRRTAEGTLVADARLGHLRHNYRIRRRLSTVIFLQTSYDPFLRVESRTLAGGGLRFELRDTDTANVALGATIMYETDTIIAQESDPDDPAAGTNSRARFSFFLTWSRTPAEGVELDIWGFYQPVADDLDDARASGAASVRVDIAESVYMVMTYVIRYDANPPAGVRELDYTLRSGVGLTF
jgi:hypothetical protein